MESVNEEVTNANCDALKESEILQNAASVAVQQVASHDVTIEATCCGAICEVTGSGVAPEDTSCGIGPEVISREDVPPEGADCNDTSKAAGCVLVKMKNEDKVISTEVINPYSYIKQDEFTSEIFKIEICNLPRFGIGELKKRMRSLGVQPIVKMKTPERAAYAFVTFRCEEDRQFALTVLNGHKWKGNVLQAKKANPAADPLLKKRKLESERSHSQRKVAKVEEDEMSADERVCQAVTPLWKTAYDEQLKLKQKEMTTFIKGLGRAIEKDNIEMNAWLKIQRSLNCGLCCELCDIKPAPQLNGYRNKCEFTVGISPAGEEKTVGFRTGSYRSGVTTVVPPTSCLHVSAGMKTLCQMVQNYLQNHSQQTGFQPETRSGNWKTVTMRSNRHGRLMVILTFLQQQLSQDEVELEKKKLTEYFEAVAVENSDLLSVYLDLQATAASQNHCQSVSDSSSLHLLLGEQYIVEDLLGLKFRISPSAFFQVNTEAAEVLYTAIADWCELTPTTILLDICCGTGTIGLTMAKRVKKLIGIEMCQEAIEDAEYNARENGITNAEFHCGKAEAVLPSLLARLGTCPVIAVVDPPRSGLHPDVIRTIRRTSYLQHLVYVSCNPRGVQRNIVDLTRQSSNRVRGDAFRLLQCRPIDLFPHTNHCELVMLLSRADDQTATDTSH